MGDAPQLPGLSNLEAYGLWAQKYDQQPNPMLSLESRIVGALLPEVAAKDVLDLGCGTGRWLSKVAHYQPASLTGVDVSPEMLQCARKKLGSRVRLLKGDCSQLILPTQSADIVIASLVASHLPKPSKLFEQIARVLRDGGSAFVSDLHPRTVKELKWTRSFRYEGDVIPLVTENWELDLLKSLASRAGLAVVAEVEAHFGEPEKQLMRRSGRTPLSDFALEHPAIYVLQLQRATSPQQNTFADFRVRALRKAQIALTKTDTVKADIELRRDRVAALRTAETVPAGAIELSGYTILPGLINAHDHLEFSLFPRVGQGPYRNCLEWYADIHSEHAALIARYKKIPKLTRVWFGALRNLLCGVTLVCHHNPMPADALAEDFPIGVAQSLGWAHSVAIDPTFRDRHRRTPRQFPFMLHAGEGIDGTAREELGTLLSSEVLDERMVLIHGLALDPSAVRRLNRARASLVWCPTSNSFLFGQTHTADSLATVTNVAIGSDSPLTSEGDLLDEIRFAHDKIGIAAESLYQQATSESARILRLRSGFGQVRVGGPADLIAIRSTSSSPADSLASLTYRDIHLMIRGGRVQLASDELISRIPEPLSRGLRPLEIDGLLRWVRAPLSSLFRSVRSFFGQEVLMNGRRLQNVSTDWL